MFKGMKAAAGAAKGAATISFIGSEASVTGDVLTSGELRLDGKVTGDVRCGSLTLGESGEVRGNIQAGEARLAGLVDGAVEAGTLALEASARITGDILYESLSIASGAEVEGRFKRRKGVGDGSSGIKLTGAMKPLRPVPAPAPLFGSEEETAEAAE
ncbi:MAG TPA: polymer-forming cytoskeletal protein [Allosphingosinicella sp.]|jgi:cytoskeletal protein CcmA (bactofilin family)